jgi:hypothetical protein
MPGIDRWVKPKCEVNLFAGATEGSMIIGHVAAGQPVRTIEDCVNEGGAWLLSSVSTIEGEQGTGWIQTKWCEDMQAPPATDLVTPEELAAAMRTLIEYVDQVRAGRQE